ncbi:hypothetical protein HN709_03340 [Candidatus Peregrinibacteria bacterium]|jgi:hypothetical protein|nr:hypothetical protein [Candidatus Peregrinibacteria bacterium]MBT7736699.1 hypothetical protein [Candidatus Peregrinibacteria bacterium]
MEKYIIYAITFLYSIGGLVTFAGFFPTMKDLWKGKPSANIHTYIIWGATTFVTSLYAIFVVKDLLFSLVINLQLAACIIVLILRLRLKVRNLKNPSK